MNTIYQQLIEKISSLFDLSSEEQEFLASHTSLIKLTKDDLLIKDGHISREIYFLNKGIIRSFYNKDGKEINTEFFFANSFVGAFTSFITAEKTKLNFQSLEEDCELIAIPGVLLEDLYKLDSKWYALTKFIFETEFIKKCKRESSFLLHDAAGKYLYFLSQYPEAESRLPLYHISSYLGISAETLSRIRARKSSRIDISQVDSI